MKREQEFYYFISVLIQHLKQFKIDFPEAKWTCSSYGKNTLPLTYGFYVNKKHLDEHPNGETIINTHTYITPT